MKEDAPLSRADKLLATLIAALLVAGIAVATVRGTRETKPPLAGPTPAATETFTESPGASETPSASETPEPSPSVTMTFTGLPPFEQTGTPSPSPTSTKLPHTGTQDGGLLMGALILLLSALGAAAALVRSES